MMVEDLCLVYSADHQHHRPKILFNFGETQDNPEKPERIEAIRSALALLPFVTLQECERHATFDELCAVHSPELVRFLTGTLTQWDGSWPTEIVSGTFPYSFLNAKKPDWPIAQAGYFCYDAGTPVGPETVRAATAAAGCALEAADRLRSGACSVAYALCRPPGHHATRTRYGGFCYLNNAALAAEHLAELGRVAVLDIDFHHGNGTQEITYESDRVMYVSIHGDPNESFPFFYGYGEERGKGAGEGYNLNLPLPRGSALEDYEVAVERALAAIADKGCRYLVVSVGYDTCQGDPLGGFALRPEDFQRIGEAIMTLGLPAVAVQEGGYVVDQLGQCAQAFVTGLLG